MPYMSLAHGLSYNLAQNSTQIHHVMTLSNFPLKVPRVTQETCHINHFNITTILTLFLLLKYFSYRRILQNYSSLGARDWPVILLGVYFPPVNSLEIAWEVRLSLLKDKSPGGREAEGDKSESRVK